MLARSHVAAMCNREALLSETREQQQSYRRGEGRAIGLGEETLREVEQRHRNGELKDVSPSVKPFNERFSGLRLSSKPPRPTLTIR